MSLSNVSGHFGNIGGSIVVNVADITKSTVNVTIDICGKVIVATSDGELPRLEELFRRGTEDILHVSNVPSPAATASLAIA